MVTELLALGTLRDITNEFLIEKQIIGASPATILFYQIHLRPFKAWYGMDTPLTEIDSSQIRAYLLASQQSTTPSVHHARFRVLRAFLNWCVQNDYLIQTPLRLPTPKLPRTIMPIFEDRGIKLVLGACKTLRDKALMMLLVDTGIRLAEITGLTVEDFDFCTREIRIMGKGQKERSVRISRDTQNIIRQYIREVKPHDRLWLTDHGTPLVAHSIQEIIKRTTLRALGKGSGPHKFRHTYASNFLEAGGDSLDLQYILGHSSLTMVERYSRATKARRALKAQVKYSLVERLGLR